MLVAILPGLPAPPRIPLIFNADRPFYYTIKQNVASIFVGYINVYQHDQSDGLFPEVGFEMRCLVITPTVQIDHPFLYSIVKVLQDQETGNRDIVPLFSGMITVPSY
ncbi:hypothetical protein X777_12686 [Ooceraea biroi]|uniref:Uncharacterized protein n=1 Tax=Ooceraea biroi TaxID=2015173 RepID=A0A026VYN4_OOCBI|nr:hypothetical protein X777_12686 [Ooceraea biroi]